MNQAINHGRSKGIVIIQDGSPIPEGSVCSDHDGATFVPVGDDLEEEFRPLLIHGEISSSSIISRLGEVKSFMALRKEWSAREAES